MDLGLAGKVALVTGASSGIGRATAITLAREGASVMLSARRAELLRDAGAEARREGADADFMVADLETEVGPERAVEATVERFGRLDILVNNGAPTALGGLLSWGTRSYYEGLEGKALAYVRAARAAVPHMRAAGGGAIVSVAGVAGRSAGPDYLLGMMSNGAVYAFTKALADEVGPDFIRVLVVDPGAIMTARLTTVMRADSEQAGIAPEDVADRYACDVPLQRIGQPQDVADVIAFLVSQRAGYMTGSSVTVDGGASRAVM